MFDVWGGMFKPAYLRVSAGFAFLAEVRRPPWHFLEGLSVTQSPGLKFISH